MTIPRWGACTLSPSCYCSPLSTALRHHSQGTVAAHSTCCFFEVPCLLLGLFSQACWKPIIFKQLLTLPSKTAAAKQQPKLSCAKPRAQHILLVALIHGQRTPVVSVTGLQHAASSRPEDSWIASAKAIYGAAEGVTRHPNKAAGCFCLQDVGQKQVASVLGIQAARANTAPRPFLKLMPQHIAVQVQHVTASNITAMLGCVVAACSLLPDSLLASTWCHLCLCVLSGLRRENMQ